MVKKWLWRYKEEGNPWNLNTFYYTEEEAIEKFKHDKVVIDKAKWSEEDLYDSREMDYR